MNNKTPLQRLFLTVGVLIFLPIVGGKGTYTPPDAPEPAVIIHYAAGQYVVNETLMIPSNTIVVGDGAATVFVAGANLGDNPVLRTAEGAENVTFRDFSIDGSGNQTAREWGHGVAVRDSNNVTVENLLIHGVWGDGVIVHDAANATVRNVTITSARRNGIAVISGDDIKLLDNSIYKSDLHGIDLEPDHDFHLLTHVIIERNTVKHSGRNGVNVASNVSGGDGSFSIANNLIDTAINGIAILSNQGLHENGLGIAGNTIKNCEYAVLLENDKVQGVVVTSNRIFDCGKSGGATIRVIGDGNVVSGNTLRRNLGDYAIWIDGDGNVVSGNAITGNGLIALGSANAFSDNQLQAITTSAGKAGRFFGENNLVNGNISTGYELGFTDESGSNSMGINLFLGDSQD